MEPSADTVIQKLGLQPHSEGGWYRETWRAIAPDGQRGSGTAIHYLLRRHGGSHWHRVDATELWFHQAGGALRLRTASDGTVVTRRIGSDLLSGDLVQATVAPGKWQAADTKVDWVLVACVVVPAFEFSGFELVPLEWEPDPA